MKGIQAITTRIRAVKNTVQITRAMELVASSKMKRAQDHALGSRLYACELAALLQAVTQQVSLRLIRHPLLQERPVEHRGILVITSDKGLCGSLNQNLFRTIPALIKDNARFIVIGRKGVQFLSRCHADILAHFDCPDTLKFQQVQTIMRFLVEAFENKKIDTVEALFSRFKNTLVQEPTLRRLVPMKDLAGEIQKLYEWLGIPTNCIQVDPPRFIIEPNGQAILEHLPLIFLKKTLYQILLEAKASEHSARMVAMKGATDNGESLMDTLELERNKARQAGITQEINEISASQLATQ